MQNILYEEGYVKEVIFVNLQVGISQLHYELTSSQLILKYFKGTLMQIGKFHYICLLHIKTVP